MYNWSTDTHILKKDRRRFAIWKLEQAINFGLNGTKLSKSTLKRLWHKLRLDPAREKYLRFLLWPTKS